MDTVGITQQVVSGRQALKQEQLLSWAQEEWRTAYGDAAYIPVWASDDCAHNRALNRVQAGLILRQTTEYLGYRGVTCPYVWPVHNFHVPKQEAVMTDGVGAFVFSFNTDGQAFDVLYVCAHFDDSYSWNKKAVALVPAGKLEVWHEFENRCHRAAHALQRSNRAYIVGGTEDSFVPTVTWESVVLPDALKQEMLTEMDTFFTDGVGLYQELNLPPFRKILLVGPPGTGKSMLCNALAKEALARKHLVVYVSASQKACGQDGADFDKIQYALNLATNSRYPAVLIVEEIDIYLTPKNKSQILNVLDGFESPNNPKGVLFIGTTNYPEIIDERIAKRPGRVDRIIVIPPIEDVATAEKMLAQYLGRQFRPEHAPIAAEMVGQTGAFVREATLHARMIAISRRETQVSVDLLRQSVEQLKHQLATASDLREVEVAEEV